MYKIIGAAYLSGMISTIVYILFNLREILTFFEHEYYAHFLDIKLEVLFGRYALPVYCGIVAVFWLFMIGSWPYYMLTELIYSYENIYLKNDQNNP